MNKVIQNTRRIFVLLELDVSRNVYANINGVTAKIHDTRLLAAMSHPAGPGLWRPHGLRCRKAAPKRRIDVFMDLTHKRDLTPAVAVKSLQWFIVRI
ncbi:hypothetical protein EVAR_47801_1 [Eumeta japonica]|uniref:Uncharacterized protein n=1 Tax=Eumeta variegata TaxID=151549 RepID=A0A4C1ZBA6_EUMVA|nr:hypothetical protein EVAR_47801_1 [Eumeta japonica]